MELIPNGRVYSMLSKRYPRGYPHLKKTIIHLPIPEAVRHWFQTSAWTRRETGQVTIYFGGMSNLTAKAICQALENRLRGSASRSKRVREIIREVLIESTATGGNYKLLETTENRWQMVLNATPVSGEIPQNSVFKGALSRGLYLSILYDSPGYGHPQIYGGVPVKVRPNYVKLLSFEPAAAIRTFAYDKILEIRPIYSHAEAAQRIVLKISWHPRLGRRMGIELEVEGVMDDRSDPRRVPVPGPPAPPSKYTMTLRA